MVPEEWSQQRIGDIATLVTSGSRGWARYYSNDGDRFIRITNLRRDSIEPDYGDLKHVSLPSELNEGKRTRLQAGDLIMSITADLGIVGLIEKEPEVSSYINQHIALIRLDRDAVYPRFVAYQLASPHFQWRITRLNDPGAKAGLNLQTIRTIPVNLPPLLEQKKIAKILATWDRAIETVENLIANSQIQKKALMQQLLTGQERLPSFSENWQHLPLSECAQCLDNRRVPLNKEERSQIQGDIPYYGANGIVDSINQYIFDQDLVLLAEDGGYFDDFATRPIAQFVSGKSWVNNHAHILIARQNTSEKWLYYSLVHRNILAYINAGTRAKLNKSDMLSIPVALPPLNEQFAIIQVLDCASNSIDALTARLTHLNQEKAALMQQLLTGKRRVKVMEDAA